MKLCVYPGSFDPITNGHLDLIERAMKMCDKLIIAVLVNSEKKPLFTFEERVQMIKKALGNSGNYEVVSFSGLLVDFMREHGANVVIRGLRAVSDFEKEFQMALINKSLEPDFETIFLIASQKYIYLSSSVVKEVASYGGDISEYVPDVIVDDIRKKFSSGARR